jgi:N-acetylglucosaminyldiphosphoundecaprenol N-acetyl-beta-D-mannosaminyltransferase
MSGLYFNLLGVRVSAIDMGDACAAVEQAIAGNKKIYMCVCPVSTVMECRQDKKVLESVNSASVVTPDGMPVVLMGRLKGHRNVRRVYGPDLMLEVLRISEKKGYKNYFYGSSAQVLLRIKEKLINNFSGLKVSGSFSPPFRKLSVSEDHEIVQMINNADPDILWVGLGSPKQDIWMYEHRDKLNARVMVGVGAAFDFFAETKKQAPVFMRKAGLEWLFRLVSEPARLWKRYIIGNPVFLFLACKELLAEKRKLKN